MDNETLLALLQERMENLKLQMARLISHFESEQRHSVRHGRDIDKLIITTESLQKSLEEFKTHTEKQNSNKDANWKFWIPVGISIVSTIIAIFGK